MTWCCKTAENRPHEEPENEAILVAGKVRDTISCSKCNKPRCTYRKENNFYTCGTVLFDENTSNYTNNVVRQFSELFFPD